MLNQQIPQVFTLILYGWAVFSSEYIKRKTTDNLIIDGFLLVIRLGLEHYIFIANNQSFILQFVIQSTYFTSIEILYSAVTHNSLIT